MSQYLIYIKKGSTFDPWSLLQSVRAYGTGEEIADDQVTILGSVDTDTPGCYQLAYSCTQSGQEGRAYLCVVVEGE